MITPEQELTVRRALATKIATAVSGSGFEVMPSPVLFGGLEDYWAVVDPKVTQKLIETTAVKVITISFLGFADDPTEGSDHSPLTRFQYGFNIFRRYSYLRADQTATPDDFDKKLLVSHSEFMAAVLNLKAAFQGKNNLAELTGDDFAIKRTTSLQQADEVEDREECLYVPGVFGHQVRLDETVELMLVDC
ncbi:MAG: hypothetical protein ABIR33_09540 [Pyrinomonadaceae bacterium]